MIRWFGNMLRTNGRAIALGPRRMGLFTWWCIVDQRVSMWTSLVGPVSAIGLALSADPFILPLYILWVALTRFLQTLLLLTMRQEVSAYYPFLLYFNQIYGSMVKVFVLFRLDRQKWTRQNTVGGLGLSGLRNFWKDAATLYLNAVAVAFFVIVGVDHGGCPPPPVLRRAWELCPTMNHDVKDRLVHEAGTQRQHVRVRIPLEAEIDGRYFVVRDWSVGGVAFEDLEPPRRVGERFTAKLYFPIDAMEFNLELACEVRHANPGSGVTGCAFTDLDPSQLSLLQYLVGA